MKDPRKKLIIFGNGVTARIAAYYFKTDSHYDVVAFTADQKFISAAQFEGLPLVPFEGVEKIYPPQEYDLFVALGYVRMNAGRAEKYRQAKAKGYKLASYISSRCSFLSQYPAGDNCFILEDNTIQPFVKIGSNVVLWSGNHIGHDAVIEDHCFIASHVVVSGFVRIQERTFIGVNATLRDAITIAPQTLIGAGAVITKNTVERGVYVPARTVMLDKKSDELEI